MNESILQKDEVANDCKKKLNDFFEINLDKGTDLKTVWDTSKAVMRGHFIYHNSILKRKTQQKLQDTRSDKIERNGIAEKNIRQ